MPEPQKLERLSRRTPARDCILFPCGKNGCGTDPNRSHGRHCEEWRYIVRTKEAGLCLLVYSGVFLPATYSAIGGDMPGRYPMGAALNLHTSFSMDREDIRLARPPGKCDVLESGVCYCGETFNHYKYDPLVLRMRTKVFPVSSDFEQPDSFWEPLEDVFRALLTEAERENALRALSGM